MNTKVSHLVALSIGLVLATTISSCRDNQAPKAETIVALAEKFRAHGNNDVSASLYAVAGFSQVGADQELATILAFIASKKIQQVTQQSPPVNLNMQIPKANPSLVLVTPIK